MGRSFLITDNNRSGKIVFFLLLSAIFFYFLWLFFFCEVNNLTKLIIILLLCVLIFLFSRNIYYSRKISVDYSNKNILIVGMSSKLFKKQIPFEKIKLISFLEKKEMVADYGEHWQKSVKVIGKQNEVLYELEVSKIVNYPLLEELCKEYFGIDYIIEDLDQ